MVAAVLLAYILELEHTTESEEEEEELEASMIVQKIPGSLCEWMIFVRNSDFTSELQDMDMDITLSDGSDSDPDFPTNSNSTQSKKNYEHTMMYAKKT